MASGLIRNGAEILTSPAGGPTLRWRFLISLNTTSAAISPNSSFKTVGIGRGIALLQNLIDIRDTGEGARPGLRPAAARPSRLPRAPAAGHGKTSEPYTLRIDSPGNFAITRLTSPAS